ncbi:unnamed protein product [Thlaspi arvense]|uniref:MBD domain-containing protein n=1 Tax=Thlaspi arvense TaxID=13288 RepID=A0AAU9SLL1_THLAR|nr:unnamed protein product [Thlaspi arvense]
MEILHRNWRRESITRMSTSTPSDNGNQPGSVAGDFPPDPLLASDSFISSTTPAGDGTLGSSAKRRPIQGGSGATGSRQRARIGMSNGTDQVDPSPDNSAHQAESKSRKRAAPGDNWLPPNWRVEEKVRTSGATAGTVDKKEYKCLEGRPHRIDLVFGKYCDRGIESLYYFEPITGRKFRSRTEVLYYLEHGTSSRGSKKAESTDLSSDHFEGQGSKRASRKAKEPPPPPLNFDFGNPPEKVSWCMSSTGEEAWTPFVGDDKVQDSVRRDWCTAFTAVTTQNPSKLSL